MIKIGLGEIKIGRLESYIKPFKRLITGKKSINCYEACSKTFTVVIKIGYYFRAIVTIRRLVMETFNALSRFELPNPEYIKKRINRFIICFCFTVSV